MAVRGSASIDTGRFVNKDKEFEKKLVFPPILKKRVNMKKVLLDSVKPWIKKRIDALLGFEDDVVTNLIYNLLESEQFPDGRSITVKLMGFLEQDTMKFMAQLWTHLVDANSNALGIPKQLLANAQRKMSNIDKLKQEIECNVKPMPVSYHPRKREFKREMSVTRPRVTKPQKQHEEVRIRNWSPSPPPPEILKNKNRLDASPPPPPMLHEVKRSTEKVHSRHIDSSCCSRSRSRSRDRKRRRHRTSRHDKRRPRRSH